VLLGRSVPQFFAIDFEIVNVLEGREIVDASAVDAKDTKIYEPSQRRNVAYLSPGKAKLLIWRGR
jgi:hypothetical protein